jgi:hypothetical protein
MAIKLSVLYSIGKVKPKTSGVSATPKKPSYPTMGAVFRALDTSEWRINCDVNDIPLTTVPLPDLFTPDDWNQLRQLNGRINSRIHDGIVATTTSGAPFIILPDLDISDTATRGLQRMAETMSFVDRADTFIVKKESELSGSSNSESGSPDKDNAI